MTAPQRQGAAAVGTVAADAELAQLVGCPDRNGAEDLVTFFQLETRPTGGGWPSSGAAPAGSPGCAARRPATAGRSGFQLEEGDQVFGAVPVGAGVAAVHAA